MLAPAGRAGRGILTRAVALVTPRLFTIPCHGQRRGEGRERQEMPALNLAQWLVNSDCKNVFAAVPVLKRSEYDARP